jgi:hypothetical protein
MTAEYRLTATDVVVRTADSASIPNDPANQDWQHYQAWLAASNTPDPYVALPTPPIVLDGSTFLGRLTDAEYAAIVGAAQTALAAGNGQIARWLELVRMQSGVNLGSEQVTAAKAWLTSAGIMTADRVAVVFAAS